MNHSRYRDYTLGIVITPDTNVYNLCWRIGIFKLIYFRLFVGEWIRQMILCWFIWIQSYIKFQMRVFTLFKNKTWLDVASIVKLSNQSECVQPAWIKFWPKNVFIGTSQGWLQLDLPRRSSWPHSFSQSRYS